MLDENSEIFKQSEEISVNGWTIKKESKTNVSEEFKNWRRGILKNQNLLDVQGFINTNSLMKIESTIFDQLKS